MRVKIILNLVMIILVSSQVLYANPRKEIIKTKKAPEPIGPYSQAIKFGDFLFVSGQIAINPENNEMINGSIEEETRQVMDNIKEILKEAQYRMDDIIKSTIYLTDLYDFKKVNEIYGEYFKNNFPARETVQVSKLPRGARIEISVIVGK